LKILLIEDDNMDASKIILGLEMNRVQISRCDSIRQFKRGWFELGRREIELLKVMQVPTVAVERLASLYGVIFKDEDDLQNSIRESLGHDLFSAHYSTIRGCMTQTVRSGRFDCVLLDLAMQEDGYYARSLSKKGTITGLCLLEDIRADLAHTPVIVITMMHDKEIKTLIERRFSGLVRHIIYKPTTSHRVLETVRRYCN
jgi:CheY-like chemotaxis protein